MKIIDGHVHVPSTRFLPRSLIEASVRNITVALEANGLPGRENTILDVYLSKLQDHNCDEFVNEMNVAGIDRAVLLVPDFTFAVKDAELDIAEMISTACGNYSTSSGAILLYVRRRPRLGPGSGRHIRAGRHGTGM